MPRPDLVVDEPRKPGRPRDTDRHDAIVDAAVEELAENGYHAFSVESVAARAGVAKTTVYRRWPSKDELVLEAIGSVKGPIPNPPRESVRGDLLYMVEGLRSRWVNGLHGRLMKRLAAEGLAQPALYSRFREKVIGPRHQVFIEVLDRGARSREIRPDYDPQWVIDMLVSPVVAAALTHRPRVTKAQVEFTVEVVMSWLEQGR
ncbi:MAG: TetR/AcrR family transcriptional regulator [Jatrophihabitans sp.]